MATKKKTKSYRSKYQTGENNDVEDLETDAPEGVSDLDEESDLGEESEIDESDLATVITHMAEAVSQEKETGDSKPEPENLPTETRDEQKDNVTAMQTAKKLGLISREKTHGARKYFPNRTRH